MKKLRGLIIFITAVALTFTIVGLQLAQNLHSSKYLRDVAARAGTNQSVKALLPDYAASKLPNPEVTKTTFAQNVSQAAVDDALDSLYTSITYSYVGKTDVVEVDISSIVVPVSASGYKIPPGTVFASDTLQVGGLAGVLRSAQKSLLPGLIVLTIMFALAILLGAKYGITSSIRKILLVTCLLLGGMFLATLALPKLILSLLSSSGLDATLREIVIKYIDTIFSDAGRYYIAWIIALGLAVIIISIGASVARRAKLPSKKVKKQKKAADSISQNKEL